MVKAALKSMERKVKESKTYLVEMKKNSFLERGEEEYYETLNKVMFDNYMNYIEILEKQTTFFKEGKSTIKAETKILKKHLNGLQKTNDYLTAYYRDNYDKMKYRYTNEKNTIKELSKTASTAGNVCAKSIDKK